MRSENSAEFKGWVTLTRRWGSGPGDLVRVQVAHIRCFYGDSEGGCVIVFDDEHCVRATEDVAAVFWAIAEASK